MSGDGAAYCCTHSSNSVCYNNVYDIRVDAERPVDRSNSLILCHQLFNIIIFSVLIIHSNYI